ncbi:hypothetical protein [Thermomicrobium sp.]
MTWLRRFFTAHTGAPTASPSSSPTRVDLPGRVVAVAARGVHTLARTADGTLSAWDWNRFGQLGLGDQADRSTPTRVGTFLAR